MKNHDSPIDEIPTMEYLPEKVREAEVDKEKEVRDLIDRHRNILPVDISDQNVAVKEFLAIDGSDEILRTCIWSNL